MIKLTNMSGNIFYLNPIWFESIYNDDSSTTIDVGGSSRYYSVKETPEQILSMINKHIPEEENAQKE